MRFLAHSEKLSALWENLFFLMILTLLTVGILIPLGALWIKSTTDTAGNFIGIKYFIYFLSDPLLKQALINSLYIGLQVALMATILAFILAFSLIHCRVIGHRFLRIIAEMPLFVPSLFPCLGLIYLIGNQGIFTPYLTNFELYGPIGVLIAGVIYVLPHTLLILMTTLRSVDIKLYQAAQCLGANRFRQFTTITLANSLYGIINAFLVAFILMISDFGIAKVLAGNYPMLATEIYKQVLGQHNFSLGAAISLILILPTVFAFAINIWARKKEARFATTAVWSGAKPNAFRDLSLSVICWLIVSCVILTIGIVVWGAFVTYWPYDFSLTLINYDFAAVGYSWEPFLNSILLALFVACTGTTIAFAGSYLSLRGAVNPVLNTIFRLLVFIPLGIPGTVLGLAYIFAFNHLPLFQSPGGTFLILGLNTLIHFYSVSYLTANAHLIKLEKNYENAGLMLGVKKVTTLVKVVIPLSVRTLLDIFVYLFINTMTTVSAVIFLYSPETMLASITIVHMDDSGLLASASAMGTLLLCVSLLIKLIQKILANLIRY